MLNHKLSNAGHLLKKDTEKALEGIKMTFTAFMCVFVFIIFITYHFPQIFFMNILMLISGAGILISEISGFIKLRTLSREVDIGIQNIKTFNALLGDRNNNFGDIQEILSYSEQIHKNLSYLKKYHRIKRKLIFSERRIISKNLLNEQCDYFLEKLRELQSHLHLHLESHRRKLKGAKFEVESTIKGTLELEQVSELQKARLDRQIEQFEELQRVLIKI